MQIVSSACQIQFLLFQTFQNFFPQMFSIQIWLNMQVRSERTQRADYTTPLYIRDLGIYKFWYLGGILEPIPHGCQGMTVVVLQRNRQSTMYALTPGRLSQSSFSVFRDQGLFCRIWRSHHWGQGKFKKALQDQDPC